MRWWVTLMLPASALAHMVSMSTGELKVEGDRLRYELRMPMYEAAHVKNPAQALLDHVRFRSAGVDGKLIEKQCAEGKDNYICTATYQFPAPIEKIDAECTLASITVPNHVHLLRAYREDKVDQAVFDLSFTSAEIRFRPQEAWEVFLHESGSGFLRAVGGLAPLLFLVSLALAARGGRELAGMGMALLVGETAACALLPRFTVFLSPRFIEAAAALTVAYLAFEIILLPEGKQRWLVVGLLGIFHGAYFSLFLTSAGYGLWGFLAGVVLSEILVVGLVYGILRWLSRRVHFARAVPVAASLLLTVGVGWFAVRVWS